MGSDLIELHGVPITFLRTATEKPAVLPLARAQAAKAAVVTNRRHEVVRLNDLDRHLVPLLDGTNDRSALADKLAKVAATGQLNVQKDGLTIYDQKEIHNALTAIMDQALANVARMALLVQ
jgi:methyltransferase-like protein